MWVKEESHFERLRTRGRTKSEDTERDKTRNYVVWWRITTVYCANLTLSILEEKNRRDGTGWVQVRQNETRRNKKRQDEAFMLPDNDKPIMCVLHWHFGIGKEVERNEMRWEGDETLNHLIKKIHCMQISLGAFYKKKREKKLTDELREDEKRKQMTDKKELVRTHIWQEVVFFKDLKKFVLEKYCFFQVFFFACYETSQKQVPARPIK